MAPPPTSLRTRAAAPGAARTARQRAVWLLAAWPLLWGLSGCETTGPKQPDPRPDLPAQFDNVGWKDPGGTNLALRQGDWWQQYGSGELDALVLRALSDNADLRIAKLQVTEAKIRADQARAGRLPTITAPIMAAGQSSGGTVNTQQSSQISLSGTYRVDAWGEQKATESAADQQLQQAEFSRDNVQRTVIGNLVANYVAFLAIGDSIALARESEQAARDILKTVEQRYALGDATVNDLEQQRAALAAQEATLPSLGNQRDEIKNTLSRLLGTVPGRLQLSDKGLEELRVPVVEPGLPSDLLVRRADLRAAEARLRAADANIELARARLLPPIDLSAQTGYSGVALEQLIQPASFFWNAVASLTVTLFDSGRREKEKQFAQTYYQEMVETYGQAVLQAVREVESALSGLRAANLRLEAQRRSNRAALNLYKSATEAYELNALDLGGVLDARKNLQRSEDESLRVKAEVLKAYAGLALALGTGPT